MDLTETIAPTSDQLDAVDLLAGPRVFTITSVDKGSAEQPVNIHLAEFPRPWRPGKSMRRVLVSCWGPDASTYIGRHVRLYCDPNVTFGRDKVGGTRISHLSHIDGTKTVPLLITRGKSAMYTVEPLSERDILRAEWQTASPQRRAEIEARVKALDTNPPQGPGAPQAEETAPSRAAADDRTPDPAPAEPDSNPLHYSADEIGEQGGLL